MDDENLLLCIRYLQNRIRTVEPNSEDKNKELNELHTLCNRILSCIFREAFYQNKHFDPQDQAQAKKQLADYIKQTQDLLEADVEKHSDLYERTLKSIEVSAGSTDNTDGNEDYDPLDDADSSDEDNDSEDISRSKTSVRSSSKQSSSAQKADIYGRGITGDISRVDAAIKRLTEPQSESAFDKARKRIGNAILPDKEEKSSGDPLDDAD